MSRPAYQRAPSTNRKAAPLRPLEGKLVIVTGGSRGIGAAVAKNLASKGASLVLGYTSDSSAEPSSKLASTLENENGINALVVQADMGNPKGPAHLVSTAKNHFSHPRTGKFQIDIIINNAGVSLNTPLGEITAEDFQWQYSVNVLGPILLMQAALPYLPHDRSGRVVNVSSVSSSGGFIGQTVYGGTKAALEAMTRTWARELAERATVNAINPGPVATDMYGATSEEFQGRMKPFTQNAPLAAVRKGIDEERFVQNEHKAGGRPAYDHEIAGVVAMLCSEDAGWSTGSVVCANGGLRFSE
ncbi:L-xylulose reductase, partial [Lecanoromycetidae sp. Uapishka_2]